MNSEATAFCHTNEETLCHLFYECLNVKDGLHYIRCTLDGLYLHYTSSSVLIGSNNKLVELVMLLLEY